MFFRSIPTIFAASLLAVTFTPAAVSAQGVFIDPPASVTSMAGLTGRERHVARELRRYGYSNVDVRSLSNGQLAHVYNLIHSGRSSNETRNLIGGVLRRGILQRGVDRFSR